jgi:hypothetical protein
MSSGFIPAGVRAGLEPTASGYIVSGSRGKAGLFPPISGNPSLIEHTD